MKAGILIWAACVLLTIGPAPLACAAVYTIGPHGTNGNSWAALDTLLHSAGGSDEIRIP